MAQLKAPAHGYGSRIRTSNLRLLAWSVAWLAATALMKFGPRALWNQSEGFTVVAVALNFCMGIGMVLATKRHIGELDELQRKVYLDALAISVGVTLIVTVPYSVVEMYHLISFQANVSHLLLLMTLTFVVSFLYGTGRYR